MGVSRAFFWLGGYDGLFEGHHRNHQNNRKRGDEGEAHHQIFGKPLLHKVDQDEDKGR